MRAAMAPESVAMLTAQPRRRAVARKISRPEAGTATTAVVARVVMGASDGTLSRSGTGEVPGQPDTYQDRSVPALGPVRPAKKAKKKTPAC